MADWTTLDTNTLLPGEPVTSAIMLALEENPRALADGATGAPKIADKTVRASGATITFSSLDDYSGIFVRGGFEATLSGGGAVIALIDFSTNDGSSFSGSVDFCDFAGGASGSDAGAGYFELFVDFATGSVKSAGIFVTAGGALPDTGSFGATVTMTGSSADITDIRIGSGGNTTNFDVIAIPQGGESA